MYLLDTNVCIDVLRGSKAIDEQLERLDRVRVYTSVMTAGELFYGAARSRQPIVKTAKVSRLLHDLPVLQLDVKAAMHYGILKGFLSAQGQILEDNDLFIAAIALSRSLTLVTHDKGFALVLNLQLEDWLA